MILLALTLLAADPGTLDSVLARAGPGDTVRLVAGRYPALNFRSRNFTPAITIDASAATMSTVWISNSSGITWVGGKFIGDTRLPVAAGTGFTASLSRSITVTGVHFSDMRLGINFDRITGGAITGNWFARMSTDGADIAASHAITVDHNACSDFMPAPLAHPDCIQFWSVASLPPSSDLTVTNNSVVGSMQGISLFNHVRDGVNDGGFDRVTVAGNTVLNTYANGISVYDCRGCVVRENSVSSLPNYLNRAQLYISGGSVFACGNDVPMVPRQGTPPCNGRTAGTLAAPRTASADVPGGDDATDVEDR